MKPWKVSLPLAPIKFKNIYIHLTFLGKIIIKLKIMNSEFEHILILFHYDSHMDGIMLIEKQSLEIKALISV